MDEQRKLADDLDAMMEELEAAQLREECRGAKPGHAPTHQLKPCVAESVVELVRSGASIRAVMRTANVAKGTVLRYKQAFLAKGGEIEPCECGQPAGHQGWCRVRFARSKVRQKVMKRMQCAVAIAKERRYGKRLSVV